MAISFLPGVASADGAWTFPICGAPNSVQPGYVPHGDPLANGMATVRISEGRLSVNIDLGNQRYDAHHAHLYSTTSGYNGVEIGASTVCWAYDNLTENDPRTAPYNEKALHVEDWPYPGGYEEDWYRKYISKIDEAKGGDWYVMVHMLGGHFAVDADGHLIKWSSGVHEVSGDADVAGNFGGRNDVKVKCNARHGRTLSDRRITTGSCLENTGDFVAVEEYFLDRNGVSWVGADGNLTAAAVEHGYDLDTEYLFFSFSDEGKAEQWGGPEGGAGGFLNGYDESRCDNWPPAGWGAPHTHDDGGGDDGGGDDGGGDDGGGDGGGGDGGGGDGGGGDGGGGDGGGTGDPNDMPKAVGGGCSLVATSSPVLSAWLLVVAVVFARSRPRRRPPRSAV